MKAEGILQVLGRPSLDRLTVLVREAAQNSWDAGRDGRPGPVKFEMQFRTLSAASAAGWLDLFEEVPGMEGILIRESLAAEGVTPRILYVSDRGTKGLGGPTRADVEANGPKDYVSFALNFGDPRDTHLGGGTYGFGKSAFFATAQARTIVVYTRCLNDAGDAETRLVAIAIGEGSTHAGENLTGRHWWGEAHSDGSVEPLRNGEADEVASKLGFPPIAPDDFGTTVAIVGPELDGRSAEDAAEWLAEAMVCHFWPKMVASPDGVPDMEFSVSVDGNVVVVPTPDEVPGVRLFVEVFRDQVFGDVQGDVIASEKPRKNLGRLLLRRAFEPPPKLGPVAREAGLTDGIHHACLMRGPRLVVEYRAGPPALDPYVWYAGVFIAEDDLDATFARAEPPTHDAWIADELPRNERIFVRGALRRIDERLRTFAAPVTAPVEEGRSVALGDASRMFGGLLAGLAGEGASAGSGSPPVEAGPPRGARLVGDAYWIEIDGRELLAQDVEVKASKRIVVDPVVGVGVWGGGAEADPPVGSSQPTFVAWAAPSGSWVSESRIAFSPADTGVWKLLLEPPPDAMTSIRLGFPTTSQ